VNWVDGAPTREKVALGVATAVLLALVVLAMAWVFRRRARAAAEAAASARLPETQPASGTVGDMRPVLGWLQFLESDETREPIHQDVTRIGRQKDNDIVLANTSVHRHHAILRREPSGTFVVVDLDTDNGVQVNGKRVGSCRLNDGDLVELGEVRMRFKAA
jgi:cbb3-type cytochrome oxidase subunit 3